MEPGWYTSVTSLAPYKLADIHIFYVWGQTSMKSTGKYFPINTSLVPMLLPMHADGEEHGYEVN